MIVLVANPASGERKGGRMMPRAIQALASLGRDHRVVISQDGDHPERAAREAVDSGAEVVGALGGDGLVSACANALIGTGVPLAIVPTGTGNDFARRLGLDHRRPLRSIGLLERGVRRSVDSVRAEGPGWARHYVCVAGAGFDSATNALANNAASSGDREVRSGGGADAADLPLGRIPCRDRRRGPAARCDDGRGGQRRLLRRGDDGLPRRARGRRGARPVRRGRDVAAELRGGVPERLPGRSPRPSPWSLGPWS